jgi:hypothetical protein
MANDTVFQVIRDAIRDAAVGRPPALTGGAGRQPIEDVEAEQYARAVLVALDHNGFKIIQAREEPDVD